MDSASTLSRTRNRLKRMKPLKFNCRDQSRLEYLICKRSPKSQNKVVNELSFPNAGSPHRL